jgi:hypothetical protein
VPLGIVVEHDEVLPIRAVKMMPPAWVIDGYLAAIARAEEGAADFETARGISIPLAEALMWLDTLQQTTRSVGRAQDLADELARDPLVQALTFVRGRAHHHWASAVDPDAEARQWVWVRADNLPLPSEKRFLNPEGERLYRELLEGRPVLSTLKEVGSRLTNYLAATERSS